MLNSFYVKIIFIIILFLISNCVMRIFKLYHFYKLITLKYIENFPSSFCLYYKFVNPL